MKTSVFALCAAVVGLVSSLCYASPTTQPYDRISGPYTSRNLTLFLIHGHDTIKPVLFTGFAPWDFRKAQCVQLFDFVFQKLWGISRNAAANPGVGHGLRASFLPAHDVTGRLSSPARGASGGLRRGLRSSMAQGGR